MIGIIRGMRWSVNGRLLKSDGHRKSSAALPRPWRYATLVRAQFPRSPVESALSCPGGEAPRGPLAHRPQRQDPLGAEEWNETGPAVRVVDQRRLPVSPEHLDLLSMQEVVQAITMTIIRGAPTIEERAADEVLRQSIDRQPIAWAGSPARDPAFDGKPHEVITVAVTVALMLRPPFDPALRQITLEGMPA